MTRGSNASALRRAGLTILFVSACLFLLADYEAYGQWKLNRTGVVAVGEVMSFSGKKGRFPIVRFQAPDGKTYTFTEQSSNVFSPVYQGEFLEVIFPPERPHDARVVRPQWLGVLILASLAVFTGCAGLLIFWLSGGLAARPS